MILQKYTIFCSLILLLLVTLTGRSQTALNENNEYLETVWTTEQGLPQNSVNAIIQSRDGYLWLGTFGGLARFDGVKFTTYNTGNTPGLKSNRILSLFEDRDRTLWIGTQSGDVMSFKNGQGTTYTQTDGLLSGFVWSINQDSNGTIWIGGQNGVSRFMDGRFQSFTMQNGLPDSQVWAINKDEQGQLLFAVGGGFARFEGEKFVVVETSIKLDKNVWTAVNRRKSGGWWIGAGSRIASFNENILQPVSITNVPKGDLRTIYETSDGTFWISYTTPSAIFQLKDNLLSPYTIKVKNDLRSMMEDKEGNLWIGTDGGGLVKLRKKKLTTLTVEDGLPSDNIRTIIDDGHNGVWIATTEGLAHWQNGKITKYSTKDGILSDYVTALCRDRHNALWIGSERGLSQFKDGKFTNFTILEGLSNPTVSVIFEDRDSNLWIGTHDGLNLFREGKFTVFRQAEGLINNDIRSVKQTPDGTLWFGTTGGLSRYKDGVFTNYGAAQGLSNDFVRDIFLNEDGSLWLATYGGGLNLLKDEKIVSIKAKDGLFDEFVSRILPDERGNFWLLGNRGISRVSRSELNEFVSGQIEIINATSYGVADGMKSSEGNGTIQPAGWRMNDGKMWFPTIKGVVIINPRETNSLPPPVSIEQVTIDRQLADLNQTVVINYGQENVEIAYTGLSFSRSEQVKFKYRLAGLSNNWINTGTRRTAYFSYLPPGEYTFEVLANNDGFWTENPATLKLIVRPPFWRTWWFLSLCGLAIALIAFGIFRLRLLQLKRKNAAQEEFSRLLINAHETERRRIAAELHDSIGQSLAMIKNSAVFGSQTVDDLVTAKEHLTEISEQSALAISEVREIAYNLRPYLLERLGLTKAISSMLNKIADNLPLKIISQIDDIDGLFENEAEISIYRIIQESLNNIIKHAEATEVRVLVLRKERQINIKIEDNGKGFDVNSQNQKRGGFGLLGIGERVRMLGGVFLIKSEPKKGTAIEIELWKTQ